MLTTFEPRLRKPPFYRQNSLVMFTTYVWYEATSGHLRSHGMEVGTTCTHGTPFVVSSRNGQMLGSRTLRVFILLEQSIWYTRPPPPMFVYARRCASKAKVYAIRGIHLDDNGHMLLCKTCVAALTSLKDLNGNVFSPRTSGCEMPCRRSCSYCIGAK
jgi:hypothetical protein